MSENLKKFLHCHGIETSSPVFQKLMEYGVTEVAEISMLKEEELLKAGRYCAVKIFARRLYNFENITKLCFAN